MNERLRILRKNLKLSQEQLGEALGVSNTAISKLENGENNITEQNVKAICREFNVNEDWLRTGEGEMFIEVSRDEEIAAFVGSVLRPEEDTFKKRFIAMLSRLGESDWEVLERMVEEMKKD